MDASSFVAVLQNAREHESAHADICNLLRLHACMQDLISVSDRPGVETSAAFLKSYEEHLVPPLLLHQADADLLELCQGIHGPDAGPTISRLHSY